MRKPSVRSKLLVMLLGVFIAYGLSVTLLDPFPFGTVSHACSGSAGADHCHGGGVSKAPLSQYDLFVREPAGLVLVGASLLGMGAVIRRRSVDP